MSVIFGEILSFGQVNGFDICLCVMGDEFYVIYEMFDGYIVVSDIDWGFFCYGYLYNGVLVLSGVFVMVVFFVGMVCYLCEMLVVWYVCFEVWCFCICFVGVCIGCSVAFIFGFSQGLFEGCCFVNGVVCGLIILVEF